MKRLYEQGGIFCTTNVTTVLFTGATVRGGSAVNWSVSIRTPREILEEWSRGHGLPVFASPRYAHTKDAVCVWLGVTDGCREEGLQSKVVRRGCEALRLPVDAVPHNSSQGHFCGTCNFGCPTGNKRGSDTMWLVDAVKHGAVILTSCKAERSILESTDGSSGRSKKCVGQVETCMSNGITKKLRIEAKVSISTCGEQQRAQELAHWPEPAPPPVVHGVGLLPGHEAGHPVRRQCYEGGVIASMHRVTERTIIETPALGPGAFASLVPWESGRDMKERMRRHARTTHASALVHGHGAGFVDGEGCVRFTPSRNDTEELRRGLLRALRWAPAPRTAPLMAATRTGRQRACTSATEACCPPLSA